MTEMINHAKLETARLMTTQKRLGRWQAAAKLIDSVTVEVRKPSSQAYFEPRARQIVPVKINTPIEAKKAFWTDVKNEIIRR